MKRIVKIIIALVIAICVSTSINVWRADAKVKRIVLKVGDSKKVSALKKNKKYSFSKKAIIKINKKGKIGGIISLCERYMTYRGHIFHLILP